MMDFPIFINKFIIGNRYLRYHPIWWWWRLISHRHFQLDDYYIWKEFWLSINAGYLDMQYKHNFEKVWGKNTQPETIILSQENFDSLQERLNADPDPKAVERLTEILNKKPPWSEE